MYRLKPDYTIKARNIEDFPHKSKKAASIMLMIAVCFRAADVSHMFDLYFSFTV